MWDCADTVSLERVLVLAFDGRRFVLDGFSLEFERLRVRVVVFVIADCRRYTVEFQADASSAWPRIRGGGVAFDLAPPAAFACSHNYLQSAL